MSPDSRERMTDSRLVRDQAFKAMNMFMTRLTDMVKDMVSRPWILCLLLTCSLKLSKASLKLLWGLSRQLLRKMVPDKRVSSIQQPAQRVSWQDGRSHPSQNKCQATKFILQCRQPPPLDLPAPPHLPYTVPRPVPLLRHHPRYLQQHPYRALALRNRV